MGITGSLGFLLTQGRTDSELAASLRLHIPGMSRATVQAFGVLQGLFGSSQITAPLRGGFGLSVPLRLGQRHLPISGGYVHGRGEGAAPSAIYLGGPDYHIGRESAEHSYSRPPIPNRESVPSPLAVALGKTKTASGTKRNLQMKRIAEAKTGSTTSVSFTKRASTIVPSVT
jgi:hypothetical protein